MVGPFSEGFHGNGELIFGFSSLQGVTSLTKNAIIKPILMHCTKRIVEKKLFLHCECVSAGGAHVATLLRLINMTKYHERVRAEIHLLKKTDITFF